MDLRADGYTISALLFSLGFAGFCYLLVRSNYIPKGLAIWGLFSFLIIVGFGLVKIMVPDFTDLFIQVFSTSAMFFQIMIACWLLFKGINIQTE